MIATELLEPKSCDKIISDITSSRAYQINWSYSQLYTGNHFLAFVAPYFEHDFEVVRFPDEVDNIKYEEFSKEPEKSANFARFTAVIEYSI